MCSASTTSTRRWPAARAWPSLPADRAGRARSGVRAAPRRGARPRRPPQRLVVFGLGKLGGEELNFSSDVDLVYAYEHDGESDGARPLDAENYFARLGQQLAKLLDEVTADGFCHRVDLRLRPYGNAGRVAWSFAAMEQYFQREGRDWERYAWQKARPVAGDIEAGERFLDTLRPFVYRRYLDYGALDGLRAMKATISAEVARKELADDIKRGPGGIREIEFLVQALQLIRGGREPALRGRRLLPALQALVAARHVGAGRRRRAGRRPTASCAGSRTACRCCATRRPTPCPNAPRTAQRIARGLGYADWDALRDALDAQRARVTAEFDEPARAAPARRRARRAGRLLARAARRRGDGVEVLAAAGFVEAGNADAMLRDLARSPGVRGLSDSARARLDRVLPALLQARGGVVAADAGAAATAGAAAQRAARSAYLALLDEQPAALARLVEVVSRSALLAERLAAYPLLLDELLDARVAGPLPDREQLLAACAAVDSADDDAEATLQALNEVRQALSFRIAMAVRDRRQPRADSAQQLAWLADGVVMRGAGAGRARSRGRARPRARRALRGARLRQPRRRGTGLRLRPRPGVPLRRSRRDARIPTARGRWKRRAGSRASRRSWWPARRGHRRRPPVRRRRAPAPGRRERPAGVEPGQLRRLPARARLDLGAPGAGARARRRRRCRRCARSSSACARDTLSPRARAGRVHARCGGDAPPHARRTRPQRRGGFDLKQGEGGLVDLEFLLQALVLSTPRRIRRCWCRATRPGLIEALREAGDASTTRTARHPAGRACGVADARARLHARPARRGACRWTRRWRPRAARSALRRAGTGWIFARRRELPWHAARPRHGVGDGSSQVRAAYAPARRPARFRAAGSTANGGQVVVRRQRRGCGRAASSGRGTVAAGHSTRRARRRTPARWWRRPPKPCSPSRRCRRCGRPSRAGPA